jgi:hypothetical protein
MVKILLLEFDAKSQIGLSSKTGNPVCRQHVAHKIEIIRLASSPARQLAAASQSLTACTSPLAVNEANLHTPAQRACNPDRHSK